MKKNIIAIMPGLLVVLLLMPASALTQVLNNAADKIIVKFIEPIDPVISRNSDQVIRFNLPEVDELNTRYGCQEARRLLQGPKSMNRSRIWLLRFRGAPDIATLIREYQATGHFRYVEPDWTGTLAGTHSPDDPPSDLYFYRQWSLFNDGTFPYMPAKIGADIDMLPAWEIEEGDSALIAGILDTGCKLDHPEFSGRIWTNDGEIPGNGIDDDNNGFIDDVHGWNFAYGNNDPTDDNGHGTCVAGVLGANGNNGMGYAGVNWHCKLLNMKVQDNMGYGYYSAWIDAIHYCVENGARVLNMSLGGTQNSNALHDAIDYALSHNVAIVAAMGNNNTVLPLYPAAYPGVIAAGSTDPDDTRSLPFVGGEAGSNYGQHISVVAPGNYIFGLDYLHDYEYYWAWSGTSFATPHIAGVASLLFSQDPGRTPAAVKSIMENTADDLVGNPYEDTPGWDQYYGYGRLNAFQALSGDKSLRMHALAVEPILIFPNPTSGPVTITQRTSSPGLPSEIIITDILGREHSRTPASTASTHLNLGSEPAGIYQVTVTDGKKIWRGNVAVVR